MCNGKKNQFEQKQIEKLSELDLDPGEIWMKYKSFNDSIKNGEVPKVNGKKGKDVSPSYMMTQVGPRATI